MLQIACQPVGRNSTIFANKTTSYPLLSQILKGCAPINATSVPLYIDIIEAENEQDKNADIGALSYIVAVLLLYSCGIAGMIIKYLKKEKQELEEGRILEDFYRGIPTSEKERVNRVAIQAFHTLTSFELRAEGDGDTFDEQKHTVCNPEDTIVEVNDEDENGGQYEDDDDVIVGEDDDEDEVEINFDKHFPVFEDKNNLSFDANEETA